jgi:diketogulonate reductase-like aldo/keto reductase
METADVRPMVNQLELHVGYMQEAAVQYSKGWGIQVQAWSPLGRRRVLEEPVVLRMAEQYGVSPAQFLLCFLLQQNIGVIPKASSMERMRQNLQLPAMEIRTEDMHMLRCLPQIGWGGEHPDLERDMKKI